MKKSLICFLLATWLGIHNGHLAIIEDGKPLAVLPYPVTVYPEKDRAALQQGILFTDQQQLCSLLEDFLS